MIRPVLDTNHFREIAAGRPAGLNLERRAAALGAELCLSVITVQEAVGGWLALINSLTAGRRQVAAYTQFQHTVEALKFFPVLSFDEAAAEVYHKLRTEHKRSATMDLKLAAICIRHQAPLLTRNVKDFITIKDLKTENWLA